MKISNLYPIETDMIRKISWTTGICLSVLGVLLFPDIVVYFFKRWCRRNPEIQPRNVNEVLFFTDKGVECKEDCYMKKICAKKEACSYQNLRRLVNLFESSTKTLDVCIYLLTCKQLAAAIEKVKRKGITVRIIADGDMSYTTGSQIDYLRSRGVFVRTKMSPFLMHHKFAVIDNDILITGSCNWTMQGLTGNWDNIIVTSIPQIVQPFSVHFSKLWEEFSEQSISNLSME